MGARTSSKWTMPSTDTIRRAALAALLDAVVNGDCGPAQLKRDVTAQAFAFVLTDDPPAAARLSRAWRARWHV